VIHNFIWGGKTTSSWVKVKWDTFTLLVAIGSLGIIDPKAQSEVLLAKLLVKGLAPRGEPWKEIIRHKTNYTQLPIHGRDPQMSNIN
jgi:hypothetical protein